MQENTPAADVLDITETIRLFSEPGEIVELRALNVRPQYGHPVTMNGYFDDPTKLAQAAARLAGKAEGFYFTPSPINPDLLARRCNRIEAADRGECTADRDVLTRRWLLIDLDPDRSSGISSTDQEHQAAIQRARDLQDHLTRNNWPEPVLASSGNGAHLVYRVDLPCDDGGMCQRILAALASQFDDEMVNIDRTTHNPGRLLKLYGTFARKGDDMAARPHRVASILDRPREPLAVPEIALRAVAELAPAPPASTPRRTVRNGNGRFDLQQWIDDHGLHVTGPTEWQGGRKWVFTTCPWNADHTNRSAFIGQLSGGGISAGCQHNGCSDRGWHDLRDLVEPGWRDKRNRKPAQSKTEISPNFEPCRPFPVDTLPEPIRSFVVKGASAIGCDTSYTSLPLLAALASAIGNTRRIQLKRGWTEPAILWVVIVGESGTQKSPAFKLCVQFARRRQDEAMKRHLAELEAEEIEGLTYEKNLTAWKRDKKSEGGPPTKPAAPQVKRYVVSDVTVEGLAPILAANPRGVLLARDELAGWIGSFDRYAAGRGGADESHWLSIHAGEALIVDRKTGHERTIWVPSATVSVAGGIQPGVLDRIMGSEHRESGLLARLLLAMPPRNPRQWAEAEVPASTEAAVACVFDRLYELGFDGTDEDPKPRAIGMTREGQAAWIEFYNDHGREQNHLTGDLAAAWSKLEGYAARLALVVHFVRWAANDPTLSDSDTVDAASVASGVTLSRWFGAEARRIYAAMGESAEDRERRRLVDWIDNRGGTTTVRELAKGLWRFRNAPHEARAALDDLVAVDAGRWVERKPGSRGGRPSPCFVRNTNITITETTCGDTLRGGFGDGDDGDADSVGPFDTGDDAAAGHTADDDPV